MNKYGPLSELEKRSLNNNHWSEIMNRAKETKPFWSLFKISVPLAYHGLLDLIFLLPNMPLCYL